MGSAAPRRLPALALVLLSGIVLQEVVLCVLADGAPAAGSADGADGEAAPRGSDSGDTNTLGGGHSCSIYNCVVCSPHMPAACMKCAPGTELSADRSRCTPCPAGTYNSKHGFPGSTCQPCPTGWSSAAGTTSCALCAAGYGQVPGWKKKAKAAGGEEQAALQHFKRNKGRCVACTAGKFSPGGTGGCQPCPPGTWSAPAAATCSDINACASFPCTNGAGVATCTDLPLPAPNGPAGRQCTCGAGFAYVDDTSGCQLETYCCSGSCANPVPKPPSFEQLPKVKKATYAGRVETEAAIIQRMLRAPSKIAFDMERWVGPPAQTSKPKGLIQPAGLCTIGARIPVALPGPPKAQGQAKLFFYVRIAAFANNPQCKLRSECDTPEGCLLTTCSGNTLSSGLILAAAHCVCKLVDLTRQILLGLAQQGGYNIRKDPCGLKTVEITPAPGLACYDFPQAGSFGNVNDCDAAKARRFNGYSWQRSYMCNATGYGLLTTVHDQSILFLASPKVLPEDAYYKYNYLDNYPATTPVNVENWSYIGLCGESLSYDPVAGETCGSQADRDLVSCQLSHTGPTEWPGKTFATQQDPGAWPNPLAINMPITSFPGNSGSCAINSPDQCCLAVSSYVTPVCSPDCDLNAFSPITKDAPLSALWSAKQVTLT